MAHNRGIDALANIPGEPGAAAPNARIGVVVITWNRRDEAIKVVERLLALSELPPVVLVDNGSTDGTVRALEDAYGDRPRLQIVRLDHNAGAVARNIGVRRLDTPFIGFCDDDTWWEPGSLSLAADVLEAHPRLAVVHATVLVEPSGRDDPLMAELRNSPIHGADWLPGPAIGSFLAGASAVRRDAFLACGGFSPRLWFGGEEELLAADLAAAGWELCYVPSLVVHHQASVLRDNHVRRRTGLRNTLWFTWLRRPLPAVMRRMLVLSRTVPWDFISFHALSDALLGLPWVLRERRVLPPHAEARFAALENDQARSTARRYVS